MSAKILAQRFFLNSPQAIDSNSEAPKSVLPISQSGKDSLCSIDVLRLAFTALTRKTQKTTATAPPRKL